MDAMPPEVPHDLVVEILLRLPVKSLVRFKSVCKAWRSLFDSPGFISRHLLNRSVSCGGGVENGNGGRSLIVKYRCPATKGDRVSLLSGRTLELNTPVEVPPRQHSRSWRIVECCNGVVCLFQGEWYLLWNPAMPEHRFLPECLTPLVRYRTFYDGFGYDPAVGDYKIVRVFIGKFQFNIAEVFTLSECAWRIVPASRCRVCSSECFSVGGVLYWGVGLSAWRHHGILSFDLQDEVFREVCYPDPGLIGHGNHTSLASSEESLCLIVFNYTATDTVWDLWVMEGGPGNESWTRRLSNVGAVAGIHKPLHCSLNGGILVEKNDGTLAICEAGKGSARGLPVKRVRNCHSYIESLVRVIHTG